MKAPETQKKKKKMPAHVMIPSLHRCCREEILCESAGSWIGMVKHSIQSAGEGVDDKRIPTQRRGYSFCIESAYRESGPRKERKGDNETGYKNRRRGCCGEQAVNIFIKPQCISK